MKEDKKKIDRSKEEELTKEQRRDENRKLSAKGIAAGTGVTALGVLLRSGGKGIENKLKKGGEVWIPEGGKKGLENLGKHSKAIGTGLLAVGIPTLGISAYTHYKNRKKKDDNKA